MNEEKTTPMKDFELFGKTLKFGNLIKSGGVNSLMWYTVLLHDKIFVFDCQAVGERININNPHFSDHIDTSVSQAVELCSRSFGSYLDFKSWVIKNFYEIK